MNETSLKDLLPETLKPGLTLAEEKLLESAQKGQAADLRSGREKEDNPENAENWGPERTIRAEFLSWLCTDPEAVPRVHARGILTRGAKIAGFLDFSFCTLPHPLAIVRSAISGIMLAYAETRSLAFSGSSIYAINADALFVKGGMFLEKAKIKREAKLVGAHIEGQLDCTGASFENPDIALGADGLSVKGGLFLTKVESRGEMRLLSAEISGRLDCTGATFENLGGIAFNADRLLSKGSMYLRDVTTNGDMMLVSAEIGCQLDCTGATFVNAGGSAFIGENIRIAKGFFYRVKKTVGMVNLIHARAGVLVDQEESWPENKNLLLDGFEYGALAGADTPQTAKKRLKWLRLQPKDSYSFQPYEQLARVFRNAGRESDAREVLIAKQEDLRERGKLLWYSKAWNRILGITIGHGYKSWRVFYFIFYFLLLGSIMFYQANKLGVMKSVKEASSGNPPFSSIIYSIDVFVPFLNLHQEDYWLPNATNTYPYDCQWCCRLFRGYLWFHISMGWLFSTLAAFSLTGLIRKD